MKAPLKLPIAEMVLEVNEARESDFGFTGTSPRSLSVSAARFSDKSRPSLSLSFCFNFYFYSDFFFSYSCLVWVTLACFLTPEFGHPYRHRRLI